MVVIVKIVSYSLLGCLFIAFFLAILGVQRISTGDEYYYFLKTISSRYESWRIEIPNIPKIDNIAGGTYDSSGLILSVVIKIANFFVNFVNVISTILNVFIMVINIVIQLIQFICTFLFSMKDFIDRLVQLNT